MIDQYPPTVVTPARTLLTALAVAVVALTGSIIASSCARGPVDVATEQATELEAKPQAAGLELATVPSQASADTSGSTVYQAPDGLTHVCSRWPSKCVQPANPDLVGHELGLICCGDGWCLAIALNSECGPAGDIFYCEHGQSIVNSQGLPDVECFD